MGLPSKFSTATLFCLAFTVVHIYGELVMLAHPYEYHTTEAERNYTCITEDDGASIIWYDPEDWSELEDSTSGRPASGNVSDCAIRGESKCLAKWVRTSDWRVVNSAAKPTGPVFDYRFGVTNCIHINVSAMLEEVKVLWGLEDLPLFQSYDDRSDNRYGSRDAPRYDSEESSHEDGTPSPRPYEDPNSQSAIDSRNEWWNSTKVVEVNKSSSTVWFSGRKLEWGDFGVVLCERYGSCLWVKIFRYRIEVRSCPSGAPRLGDELRVSKCDSPSEVVHRDIWSVGGSMWVQYRLEWDTRQETIKIFRGNDSVPLVQGTMPSWDTVFAVGVTMRYIGPRVRFHFFDYYFTDTKNSVISTSAIVHHGEMFCAELLVGLCPKCKLNVTLQVNRRYDAGIETWSFSGDEQDPYNGLLRWQLVKLNTRFDTDIRRILSLKIETILEGDVDAGEWAIDNFRIPVSCQPEGKLKESRRTSSIGATAVCQKLSLADDSVAESGKHYKSTVYSEVASELSKFLRHQTGPLVGQGGIIFGGGEYICDRGFTGTYCYDECDHGFYGFDCRHDCGFCSNFEFCNKSTGFCDAGCDVNMIGPFCKTVFVAPTVEDVKDTTATILQDFVLDEDEVLDKIEVQIREAGGDQTWTNFTAKLRDPERSSVYEAQITGLKPSTVYTVRAAASVESTLTFSPEYNLTTRLGTNTDNEKYTTPGMKPSSTGESPSSPAVHHQDQTEAPTVVNVTASSAKIIQNVKPAGHDGQIFVFFVLREVRSNASVALLPTNAAALSYELDAKNLKPNSLYKVYTLVTVLESDRAVTLVSSPSIFKTKCPDDPNFEVTPSEGGLTVDMLSRPEGCYYPANREYTVEAHNTEDWRRFGYGFIASSYTTARKFPVAMGLSPDTEYEVKISTGRWKNRRLVFTTKIRTSAAEEASHEDYATTTYIPYD